MNNCLEDMTGKKFGNLTILGITNEKKYPGRNWLCQCECGNETIASTGKLKSGQKKSCGCKKHSIIEDLTGKEFGWLKVIRRCENVGRAHAWICECVCGTFHKVRGFNLISGSTTSCGCKKKTKSRFRRKMPKFKHTEYYDPVLPEEFGDFSW